MTNCESVTRNPRLTGFRSLDGVSSYGVVDLFQGAPHARAAGRPTSVSAQYSPGPSSLPPDIGPMAGYSDWLPYVKFPSLGEGGTPLQSLPGCADRHDLSIVLLKREAANPTGSHKDRMTPLAVARALEIGARGVTCASTGNAAVSLAAYAALSGLPCRIAVTPTLTDPYRRVIQRMGSAIDVLPDHLARWKHVARLVEDGWFPVTNYALPAVGSNPFGVQGYRTIAFELFQQAGMLDAVLVPTARGDLIWGIADGFRALADAGLLPGPMPRLIAVEPYPRLERVIAGLSEPTELFRGNTRQFSTAGETTTDQARRAVIDTLGTAISVDDSGALAAQTDLARHGVDLELCAAAAFAALGLLRSSGTLRPGARVAVIGTAGSTREPAAPLPPLLPGLAA